MEWSFFIKVGWLLPLKLHVGASADNSRARYQQRVAQNNYRSPSF
jgi:hypothetical protein